MKTILLLLPLLLTSCSEKPILAAKCVLVVFIILAVAVFIGLSTGYTSDDGGQSEDYADDEAFNSGLPSKQIGFGPREELEMVPQIGVGLPEFEFAQKPCKVMDTEALAELMHDAYQTSGIVETRKIVLWQGIRNEPQKHAERNAWRAAARAVAKRLA